MKPQFWNKGKLYLSKKDQVLKAIIFKYSKENLSVNSNYFICLLNAIIGQQISVVAANSIKKRFFSLNKNINPKSIFKLDKRKLKNVGLSRQKILYILNISEYFIENKNFFKYIHNYENDEIIERLISVKGIGKWTADMFLIFSLGRADIFPKGDLGFLKAISLAYNRKIPLSEKNLNIFYERWKPYNTIATWYLWRSLDPIPINY